MTRKPIPTCDEMIAALQAQASPERAAQAASFGITPTHALGLSMPAVRALAKGVRSHELAQQLWASGIHEARILAGLVDEPGKVTREQMDSWAADFDSWDICDQVCMNLFDRTPFALDCIYTWCDRKEEFVRRASFALMACLAVHDKKATDDFFVQFLPLILRRADDGRNYVKKAVSWALRQIGKRDEALRRIALETAQEMQTLDHPAARWIARDAIQELTPKPPHS